MILGQRTLFSQFFEPPPKRKPVGRGRSVEELEKRNRLLSYRYYYFVNHLRYTYTDAIKQLNDEFFIAEMTIIKTLSSRQEELKHIFAEKPTGTELKKQYPWLVWQ